MTGHNHHPNCLYPWCVNYRPIAKRNLLYTSPVRASLFASYSSFIIPNASCPVCGASVFFYQSISGGRVFFDEIGPPWPKHPCTDNPSLPLKLASTHSVRQPETTHWQRQGWEPILIRSSRVDGNWHAISVENLKTRLFYDALTDAPLRLTGEVCALMLPWDSNGWSTISFINFDPALTITEVPVFERKRHFRASRNMAVSQRSRSSREDHY